MSLIKRTSQSESEMNRGILASNSYQSNEEMIKNMTQSICLLKRNKNKNNEFLNSFTGPASDALAFIKKFKKIESSEENLKKITKECDKKQIMLVE